MNNTSDQNIFNNAVDRIWDKCPKFPKRYSREKGNVCVVNISILRFSYEKAFL